jgi:hypothetical protein
MQYPANVQIVVGVQQYAPEQPETVDPVMNTIAAVSTDPGSAAEALLRFFQQNVCLVNENVYLKNEISCLLEKLAIANEEVRRLTYQLNQV